MRQQDVLDAHHLGHASSLLGCREVGAHPGADASGFADIERHALGIFEDVDARRIGQTIGEMSLGALGGADAGCEGLNIFKGGDAQIRDTLEEPVQHVSGGASIVKGPVGGSDG